MTLEGKKDASTVTPDGARKMNLIEGVRIRSAVTQVDDRGTLTEIYNPAWGFLDAPLVYIYQFTIRPGRIKGWVHHKLQEDRIYVSQGTVKIVLFDNRPESPTYRLVNEIYASEYHRILINFPTNVYHAIQNVGEKEALLINMPTRPYNHDDPDKFRLPMNNDLIPYRFDKVSGH